MVLICDFSKEQYGSLKMLVGSKHVGSNFKSFSVKNFYISALVGIIRVTTNYTVQQ